MTPDKLYIFRNKNGNERLTSDLKRMNPDDSTCIMSSGVIPKQQKVSRFPSFSLVKKKNNNIQIAYNPQNNFKKKIKNEEISIFESLKADEDLQDIQDAIDKYNIKTEVMNDMNENFEKNEKDIEDSYCSNKEEIDSSDKEDNFYDYLQFAVNMKDNNSIFDYCEGDNNVASEEEDDAMMFEVIKKEEDDENGRERMKSNRSNRTDTTFDFNEINCPQLDNDNINSGYLMPVRIFE